LVSPFECAFAVPSLRPSTSPVLPAAPSRRPAPSLALPLAWALIVACLSPGCGGAGGPESDPAGPDGPAGSVAVAAGPGAIIGMQVVELQPQPFSVAVTAPGTVRADQDATALVGPIIEGRIGQVLAGPGDAVARGQVLAWLDSVAVGDAKAAYFRARAELQVAEGTLKRMQLLSEGKIAFP